jgi:hypothetical protein
MPRPDLEAFLARIYTDAPFRDAFLRDREATARAEDLEPGDVEALLKLSEAELLLAAGSFEHKRTSAANHRHHHHHRLPWWRRVLTGSWRG